MSIGYRPMRAGQEEAVATLVRQLPKDLGMEFTPALTGEILRQWQGQHHVMVAENAGLLCGVCTWFYIYSTWRGTKGIYVSDLYVHSHLRGRKIGEGLLRATAKEAAKQGASFIKLDVRRGMPRQMKFYETLGFTQDDDIHTYFLEQEKFNALMTEQKP
ncbi:MAG: GNAT family N-acetyltransferase [Alphaproteobacteria bacterium]|nr:GNAT family N-acetyltransferase [Alphaproteobacteria bacterium]